MFIHRLIATHITHTVTAGEGQRIIFDHRKCRAGDFIGLQRF